MSLKGRPITADIAMALDPALLARACGIDPDPWQADMLRSGADRSLLLCTRQAGKSTVTALKALHTALYPPRGSAATVLLVAPGQRQSGELFRKVAEFYRRLPNAPDAEEANQTSLSLDTGSRIVALPGIPDTIRGYAADLVVLDEAAMVDDETFAAVGPSLATTGGALVALSTPKGRRGRFFEWWQHGGEEWARFKITADECPRIDRKFIEQARREMSPQTFRQEFYCEFYDTDAAAFPAETIERALHDDFAPF